MGKTSTFASADKKQSIAQEAVLGELKFAVERSSDQLDRKPSGGTDRMVPAGARMAAAVVVILQMKQFDSQQGSILTMAAERC